MGSRRFWAVQHLRCFCVPCKHVVIRRGVWNMNINIKMWPNAHICQIKHEKLVQTIIIRLRECIYRKSKLIAPMNQNASTL